MVLSRALAEAGHYPAIDIEASISRAMTQIIGPEQAQMAQSFKRLFSRYQRNRDLISVGAYSPGHDPQLDEAVQRYPALEAFLQQHIDEQAPADASLEGLARAVGAA